MKRQLMVMVLATTSLVLVALLVPMGILVQRFVEEDALSAVGFELQQVETMLATAGSRAAVATELESLNAEVDGARASVLYEDGEAVGPNVERNADVERARTTGETVVVETAGGAQFIAAAYGRQDPVVIRLEVAEDRFSRGVTQSWAVLAVLGVTLLGLALVVADRLGTFFVRPLVQLGSTAARLGRGELDARVAPTGPPDVQALGSTFNQLADRVGELLAVQREDAADLAHRLRTPLTAMRLDAENLPEAGSRARMSQHVDDLAAMVSAIIDEARRPIRAGVGAGANATAVVGERVSFWSVLAEDQDRPMTISLPHHPVQVRTSVDDLAAAVDALLGNVFDHTPEGTALTVTLVPAPAGGAVLTITDTGPGMPDAGVLHRGASRGGSTGLGLDIARRTGAASGGGFRVTSPPSGGATCELTLGGPPDTGAHSPPLGPP